MDRMFYRLCFTYDCSYFSGTIYKKIYPFIGYKLNMYPNIHSYIGKYMEAIYLFKNNFLFNIELHYNDRKSRFHTLVNGKIRG